MTVREQLQAASFKSFPFLVNTERNDSGKKLALHEYPNSDKRFAEELGQLPPTFVVNAIVHGDVNLRLRFEQLLTETGLGTLVHPIYGTVQVMAGQYSVSSNQTRIGEFLFSITFYTTELNITAEAEEVSTTEVSSGIDSVQIALGEVFTTAYTDPTFVDSFNDAADKTDDFFASIQQKANAVINPVTENLSLFNTFVDSVQSGIFTLVEDGTKLKEAFESVFISFANIANTPADLADAYNDLTSFGSDDSSITNTTVKRQEIIDNRNSINDYVRVQALSRLYEAQVFSDFSTDEELLSIQDDLDSLFVSIMLDSITPESLQEGEILALDSDVRSNMNKLRNDAKQIFDDLLQNIWRVVTIGPLRSSMFVTTYRYYGSSDNLDLLINLNPERNVAGFNSEIKAVSR